MSRHAHGLARRTAGARLPGAGGGLSRPGAGRTGERRGLARHPRGAVVPADRRGRRQPPAGGAWSPAGSGRRAVHRRLSGGGDGRRAGLRRRVASGGAARRTDAGRLARGLWDERHPRSRPGATGSADPGGAARVSAALPGQRQRRAATGGGRQRSGAGRPRRTRPCRGRQRGEAPGGERAVALCAARRTGRAPGRSLRRHPPASSARALPEQQPGAPGRRPGSAGRRSRRQHGAPRRVAGDIAQRLRARCPPAPGVAAGAGPQRAGAPLFGCATPAFEDSRPDTLDVLLREEEKRTR